MPPSDTVRVKTDQLPVGSRLSHPINDGEDRLLGAAVERASLPAA